MSCLRKLSKVNPSPVSASSSKSSGYPPSASDLLAMMEHVNWEPPASLTDVLGHAPNKFCIDCQSPHQVEWASLGFGTLVCLNCAGFHRSLGVHITAVKSTALDRWTDLEVLCLRYGGNDRFHSYYVTISPSIGNSADASPTLPPIVGMDKYTVAQLLFYSKILKDRITNDPDGLKTGVDYVSNDVNDKGCHNAIDGGGDDSSNEIISRSNEDHGSGTETLLSAFKEEEWIDIVKYVKESVRNYNGSLNLPSNPVDKNSSHATAMEQKRQSIQPWVQGSTLVSCMICGVDFTFFTRRHHCRRCGRMVCSQCAPSDNSRPILEWGLKDPVRHCKLCYRSPMVQWTN